MRQGDVDEVWAAARQSPASALCASVAASRLCWTFAAGDEPVSIFGYVPPPSLLGCGAPWMLATERLADFPVPVLRASRKYIPLILDECPALENWVDARNEVSIRWLKWCGFTLHEPEPFGVDGLPFHRFDMRREQCAA